MATFGQHTTRWNDSARSEKPHLTRFRDVRKEQASERADRSITTILYGILFPAIICGLLAITLYHLHPHANSMAHPIEWIKILMEGAAFAGFLLIVVVLTVIFAGGTQELLKRFKHRKISPR